MGGVYDDLKVYKGLDASSVDKRDLRPVFFEFFDKFKEYLAEYTRESLTELAVSEVIVGSEPRPLFEGLRGVRVTLKNQGDVVCYLTTDGEGKFKLDPGEKQEFWVNRPVVATTISGTTVLGFIRC